MAIEVGQQAPDFELLGAGRQGQAVGLPGPAEHGGRLLPVHVHRGCTGELCDDLAAYQRADAQVLAVSCDSPFAQAKFAAEQGYTFPVLSDFWPHGAAAKAYGVFNEALGAANRGTFVIDKQGNVASTFSSPDLKTPWLKAR